MSPRRSCLDQRPRIARRLLTCAGLWLLACGGADHVSVPEPPDADAGPTKVNSDVNVCPVFGGSLVMPQRIGPSEAALIIVRASDPDSADSSLIYAWSAASGTFSANDRPVTNYRCSEPGTESLTVTAKDAHGCISSLTIDVECVAN